MREVFDAIAAAEVQKVRLPKCGLTVLLRHPGPVAVENLFGEYRDLLEGMREEQKANAARPAAERQYAASIAFADLVDGLMARIFVEPGFGPRPGQIRLRHILPDFAFISRWLEGEVVAQPDGSASDLAAFPGGRGEAGAAGVGGAREPVPPEPTAGTAGDAGLPH
jgi:hypothetical protein